MKRLSLYTIFVFAVTVVIAGFRFVDEQFLEKLKSKLTAFNQQYPEERIYLQFDKTLFKPGEIVWYKAYVLNGTTLAPTTVSTAMYVELVDPRGAVVKKSELYVEDGAAHGDFMISQGMPGGLYTVRAFTRWMQNFPEENFFTKEITIQSVITPRLLLKVDFEKKAYGKTDTVVAKLKARNLKDQPIAQASIKAILNLKGTEYQSKTFQANDNGEADIAFQLPADLNTTDGLLQLIVSYGMIEESISRSVPIVLNKIQMRFFPEGGEMLAGSNGRVAFEALNEFNKGADVEGIIVDETDRTVSKFESYHLGMGAFKMQAQDGHTYSARITRPQGINEVYPLPVVKSEGMSLSVEVNGDSIVTKIFSSATTQAFLVAHVHGQVFIANKLTLQKGWNESVIPAKPMPIGIATFTLFDGDGIESSERLAFINRDKTLRIGLTTDRKEYMPGDKVEVKLKTTDQSGSPVRANLSLAVVDDQLLTHADDKQDNILSWLLMSSELKGKIEEPSFYFKDDEPKAKLAMDYLLMSHGWRRFAWKEVLEPNKKLAYIPENDRNLSGFVLNKDEKGSQSEVVLIELNNRKRLATVKSGKNGQFLFRNVDASTRLVLLTRKPNMIEVGGVRSASFDVSNRYSDYVPHYRVDPVFEIEDQPRDFVTGAFTPKEEPQVNTDIGADVDMNNDVQQLQEVVVTGYASETRRDLTGSIVSIPTSPAFNTIQSIEQLLSGRVGGIMITQPTQPNIGTNLLIRGMSSISNQNEPLWVVDGIPFARGINSNFSNGSQLATGNIKSITVLNAGYGSALYGSQGSHGVIVIETKTRPDNSPYNCISKPSKYSALMIEPRKFTVAREFYPTTSNDKVTRKNFETTVSWKYSIVTDDKGEAKIEFTNNDAVSAFRITAEGVSGVGLIGRQEITYHTLLPFSLDTRIPNYLGFEDTLKLPVRITNNTKEKLKGKLFVQIPDQLRLLSDPSQNIEVEADQTITIQMWLTPSNVAGEFPITIEVESDRHHDKIKQSINVHPVGFPAYFSYSGKDINKTIDFQLQDVEKGSLKGEVVFVANVIKDMVNGIESLLAEPHGCFEQTSSSTFPNILVLQLLRKSGRSNPDIEKKALNLIDVGYKRLAGFEVKGGGFDWFGNPPSHEALTAFGLIEFHEMQKVYSHVNAEMVMRTKKWLLSRRKGDGTFNQTPNGLDHFSATVPQINDAYILYALSEVGVDNVDLEYTHSLDAALKLKDMYIGALMANAALNYGKNEDFNKLKKTFVAAIAANELENLKVSTSFTNSYGRSLTTETIALWTLALMKEQDPDYNLIAKCVEFIGSQKSFSRYGSTQATYLSLKVMAEFYNIVQSKQTGGEIAVSVNHNDATRKLFTNDAHDNVVFNEISSQLKDGNNSIGIALNNTSQPLPFSVDIKWNSKTPKSHELCMVKIETNIAKTRVPMNETVRLEVKLTNTRQHGVSMTMAVVGIPAGLGVQAWQLKELKEKGMFDFYEIIGDKLVMYYRGLHASETKTVNLDLKAEVPGTFLATASCGYLYYNDEHKNWAKGTKVTVY